MKEIQRRARDIQKQILNILALQWNPLQIGGDANANKEYECSVGIVYRLLASKVSEEELENHLHRLEIEEYGIETIETRRKAVVKHLLSLNIALNLDIKNK